MIPDGFGPDIGVEIAGHDDLRIGESQEIPEQVFPPVTDPDLCEANAAHLSPPRKM